MNLKKKHYLLFLHELLTTRIDHKNSGFWHRWFHEEPLNSVETFYSKKGPL